MDEWDSNVSYYLVSLLNEQLFFLNTLSFLII